MAIEHFQINFEIPSVTESYLDDINIQLLRREIIQNFPSQFECLDAHLIIKKSIEVNKDILWFAYTGEYRFEILSDVKNSISISKQNITKVIEKFLNDKNLPYKLL